MKSEEYWQKRVESLQVKLLNKGVDYYNSLADEYNKALKDIQKEIEAWFMRYAREEGISYADAKKILTKAELKVFKMDIKEYIAKGKSLNYSNEWRRELERASARWHISRLESLQIQIQQHIESLYASESDGLHELLSDVFSTGYYHTAFEIQKGIGLAWNLHALDTDRIEKIVSSPWTPDGTDFSKRIWGNHRSELVNYLKTELTQTIIRGESPQQLILNTAKKFGTKRSQAANLIMTEAAAFSSMSQEKCYKDLNVERYSIVATLDMKTSEKCRSMDGKVFKRSEYEIGVTAPPFHNRCRTVTAPYFDDEFTTDNMRAARGLDGKTYQIPANIKYEEWKNKYVKTTPEYAILKAKNELGIKGDLSFNPILINTKDYDFDFAHINEERKHGVTRSEAERFIKNAEFTLTRWNGRYINYYSKEGAAFLDIDTKNIRTSFPRSEYDKKIETLMEVVENERHD